jgi:hypothetical protein
MTVSPHRPRFVALAALVLTFGWNATGADRKVRVFNSGFEAIWTAAVDVAREGFQVEKASREQGRLRFRTGPFRGYRFEAVITEVGVGKTQVTVELLTNYYAVPAVGKDAWRTGDRYLSLLGQRLEQHGKKSVTPTGR